MTAEIAILNKSAVALATDSAATVSSRDKTEKIFDSADKLFELSYSQPIAIMIYNEMSFLGIPLPSLIKHFRDKHYKFDYVIEAGMKFFEYLHQKGGESENDVLNDSLTTVIAPIISFITETHAKRFMETVTKEVNPDTLTTENAQEIASHVFNQIVDEQKEIIEHYPDAKFFGSENLVEVDKVTNEHLKNVIKIGMKNDSLVPQMLSLLKTILLRWYFSDSKAGIIIAGFGEKETFPALVVYEIDGVVCRHLKYKELGSYDIDRSGTKAAVLPFAQKEMVDRFLYGLDNKNQATIKSFCSNSVNTILNEIFNKLDFSDPEKAKKLKNQMVEARNRLLEKLNNDVFRVMRIESQNKIEDIVEFMPKPELAKMAEALVDLTSIKRRVSRGMETVGGPIDVAVISKKRWICLGEEETLFPVGAEFKVCGTCRVTDGQPRKGLDDEKSTKESFGTKSGI